MRAFIYTCVVLLVTISGFSQTKISKVFTSEPQNKMAAEIPKMLLEAYRNGDIVAYYPANMNVRIPYAQFLNHCGEKQKAQDALTLAPAWYCTDENYPKVDSFFLDCLTEQFEIGEKLVVNSVTMMNEMQQSYIRLIFSQSCNDIGNAYGPVFKLKDIEKLKKAEYKITNLQNSAFKYSVFEMLKLRLYNAVPVNNR